MKKATVLLLCFALILGMFAGCGQKQKATEPVTVTVWNYYTGTQLEAFNALVDEFNQTRGKELGITVEASSEGSVKDLESNVLAAARKDVGAKEVPNIFAAYSDTAHTIDQMGLVADISEYFTPEEKSEYIDSYLLEGDLDSNGSIKIFPIAKATEIFMLNATDWQKFADATGAQLETLATMEGVVSTAEAYYHWTDSLTDTPDDGKAFFGRDAMANYILVGAKQLGVELISRDENGEPVLNFPKNVVRKLWDHYYVPFIKGYFSAIGRFRTDDVKTGNLIGFVGSSSSAAFFPKEVIMSDEQSYPIEHIVLTAPRFAGGKSYAIQQGAGMVVTKGEENVVRACVEFLKWFTDTQYNIGFSLASSYMPVKKEANDMDMIRKYVTDEGSLTEALETSIETIQTNTMYTPVATANGAKVRSILEYAMSDQAVADLAQIEERVAQGESREEAIAQYETDAYFDAWYEATKAKLEAEFQ